MKINNTLKNLIIFCLGITIVLLIVLRPSKEVLSDYHKIKYKEYQTTKDSLLNEIKEQDKEINNLIRKYETVDSIYNTLDKRGTRERANDIFRFK
jgi:hypothetical protein